MSATGTVQNNVCCFLHSLKYQCNSRYGLCSQLCKFIVCVICKYMYFLVSTIKCTLDSGVGKECKGLLSIQNDAVICYVQTRITVCPIKDSLVYKTYSLIIYGRVVRCKWPDFDKAERHCDVRRSVTSMQNKALLYFVFLFLCF